MRAPMAYWGPDGGGVWREGCAGLGQLVAHHTPEAVHEDGPVVVAGGTIVVSPAGRIDNRDELCVALEVPAPERATTADGRLIALAYERWGDDAPRRLLGDWAFAAWHPRERRLVLARDHYGHTALYWHRSGSTLAFASSLKGVLALPEVPRRLDEIRLGETLVICAARGAPTMYEGIERLPTARILTFDAGGVRTREYWSLLDVPEVRLASDAAYVERAQELLDDAVRVRLRTTKPVATTLSAGPRLDRRHGHRGAAARRRAAHRLHLTPRLPGGRGRDARRARRRVAARPRRRRRRTGPSSTSRSGGGRHAARRHRPLAVDPRGARARGAQPALDHGAARRRGRAGAGVLLTGQMGNGSLSWPGEPRRALDAIAAGDPAAAWRRLRHARAQGRGGWRGATWRGIVAPAAGDRRGRADAPRPPPPTGVRGRPDEPGLRRPDRPRRPRPLDGLGSADGTGLGARAATRLPAARPAPGRRLVAPAHRRPRPRRARPDVGRPAARVLRRDAGRAVRARRPRPLAHAPAARRPRARRGRLGAAPRRPGRGHRVPPACRRRRRLRGGGRDREGRRRPRVPGRRRRSPVGGGGARGRVGRGARVWREVSCSPGSSRRVAQAAQAMCD